MDEVRQAWLPQPDVPLIEWLPAHIRLPAEDSAKPGAYRVESVPYFWGVMHALDSSKCWMVVLQKAAQIGWTVLLAADICKVALTKPVRALMLFPKDEKGRLFMDEKLVPIIENSPDVARVIDVTTSRKSGSRTTRKKFPGGEVRAVGSNSVSNVKSTTASRGYVEEPDDTNKDVGDQGDSIRHLRERLKRMTNKKLIIGGTPSVAGLSQVEHYTRLGTMRVLPVVCHDCGDSHVLDWENVTWEAKEHGTPHPVFGMQLPDTAIYSCPHCGSVWDDYRRKQNIISTCVQARNAGDPFAGWVKTACGEGFTGNQEEPVETFLHLSELYVCMDGTSLADVVRDYLEAEHEFESGDDSARIVFVNNKLGLPYQFASDQVLDHEALQGKAEDYPELHCPEGGLLVTSGVDVQHDRLAVLIRAFGRDEESWQMYWGEIDGNPFDKNDECWNALDRLLFQAFGHERFGEIRLAAVTIDASDGGTSNAVYHWVRTRSRQHKGVLIIAGKGDSNDLGTKEIFRLPHIVDRVNPKRATKADRHGVKIYMIGTHKAKDLISKRLTGTSARMHSCAHVRVDYWEQVTAEVKAPSKRHRGKLLWQVRPGKRNEALDCEVYALHAAHAKGMHRFTDQKWSEIEARAGQRTLFNEPPTTEDDAPPAARKAQQAQPIASLLDN